MVPDLIHYRTVMNTICSTLGHVRGSPTSGDIHLCIDIFGEIIGPTRAERKAAKMRGESLKFVKGIRRIGFHRFLGSRINPVIKSVKSPRIITDAPADS